jgi:hypothetical protein
MVFAAAAFAQTPRFEIGVQASVLDERKAIGEKPAMAGGRISARVFRFIDADFEVNRFPIGGAQSSFPGTEVLLGGRAGYHLGHFGLFGRMRPGFVKFDRNQYPPQLGTRPALDIGGTLEIYSSYHVAVRIDYGDTIVWYGPVIGTRHQLQGSFGVGVWF